MTRSHWFEWVALTLICRNLPLRSKQGRCGARLRDRLRSSRESGNPVFSWNLAGHLGPLRSYISNSSVSYPVLIKAPWLNQNLCGTELVREELSAILRVHHSHQVFLLAPLSSVPGSAL